MRLNNYKIAIANLCIYNYWMRIFETVFILTLFLAAQILTGCSSTTGNQGGANPASNVDSRSAAENSNTAKDSIEELGTIVTLPIKPEEAAWREDATDKQYGNASTGGKKLTAVLRFTPQDADKLAAERPEYAKPPLTATINPDKWFPSELIAQSDLSGDDTLKGSSYSAKDFYLAPYTEGRLIRIENTDYFILELYSR